MKRKLDTGISYTEWSETRRFFIGTAFELCFRIWYLDGPIKSGLILNGKHQLPAYADDLNMLSENINTVRRDTECPWDDSKEVGLEVSAETTDHTVMSLCQKRDEVTI